MTKNDNSESKQTVRVFGADGELIGTTYPKRAAGLVKKGRAQYVNYQEGEFFYTPSRTEEKKTARRNCLCERL